MNIKIENNHEEGMFLAIDDDDNLVGEIMYIERNGYYDVYHTAVEPQFEGKGIASKMVRKTLEYIREKNIKIFARCPYTANFISKHPEFNDILFM